MSIIAAFVFVDKACAEPASKLSEQLEAKTFANPPAEYRPVDCWWWDGDLLTKERITEQLEDMHAKGVGGTWLYPRFGAGQPRSCEPGYFTPGWWEFVRYALDEHTRLGMIQFANDWLGRLDKAYFQTQLRNEAKTNSKLAGTRLVPHFARSKAVETITVEVPHGEKILSAVAYRLRDTRDDSVDERTRVDLGASIHNGVVKWDAPGPDWLVAIVCTQPHDLNYLERAVADRWAEIFYERYRDELDKRLGKSLTGYGPDERSILGGNILYSDSLRVRFERDKGHDPRGDLAALFIDIGPRTAAVRCQYYDVMNSLLEQNLYAPMADWLHKHGMKHVTIATWGREHLLQQTSNYGDFMRMMKYFDIPGNEDSKESGPNGAFIDSKLSSSIAHLQGGNRAAFCAYWGMGWGFTQAENIARTNVNYALGLNLYNTHGVSYSLQAGRNEWVPPEIHFYQPYWGTWRTFTDYATRLSYALSQGKHRADVAVVYPLSTIHACWHGGSKFDAPADDAQRSMFALAKSLYANSLDFDFIDEARLAEATSAAGKVNVAGLEFPVIVLPSMTTIRTDTLAKLSKFVDAGGTLVVFKQLPTASAEAGRDDPNVQKSWQSLLGDYAGNSDSTIEHRNHKGGRVILVRSSEADISKVIRTAIHADVTTASTELAHTHHEMNGQHVYYFVNKQPNSRSVAVTVGAQGRPEIWNARTGEVRPLHRFRQVADGTELRLEMDAGEGVLVVLQPEAVGPQVVADNLLNVESVEKRAGELEVVGTADTTKELRAEVALNGRTFVGTAAAVTAAKRIDLDGLWECVYRPTMNNKWADFRYPASNEFIGPEVPRMKYRAEAPGTKERPNWESNDVSDIDWQQVTCTFGPYWQALDPIEARLDSESLQQRIVSVGSGGAVVEVGGHKFQWQPYAYSWKLGTLLADFNQTAVDGMGPVPREFLVFAPERGKEPVVRYLATRVYSPQEQELYFDFASQDRAVSKVSWRVNDDDGRAARITGRDAPRQAWVNGTQVTELKNQPSEELPKVKLQKGWNDVLLRIAQAPNRQLAAFAVFHSQPKTPEQPRFMPLLRWHDAAPELVYDCLPAGQESIGWYRFIAPPGTDVAKLSLVAQKVEAWVDGKPVQHDGNTLWFPRSPEVNSRASQVALRVHNKPGYYEGAAFTAPVSFLTSRGELKVGDWCDAGLAYYSGGVKYKRTLKLDKKPAAERLVLDLGDVRTSAEVKVNGKSLGVRLAPPFTFDITAAVREGENRIEVEVLNTLANFMSATPSKYVYKGQTVSGLLGPVRIQSNPQVRVVCKEVDPSRREASDGGGK